MKQQETESLTLGYTRQYCLMVVPVSTGGDYAFGEARAATETDLARAGFIKFEDEKQVKPRF